MPREGRNVQRAASLALAVLAAAAVVAGLLLTGGPMQARKERRDDARAADLMAMAQQVECLTQDDGALPGEVAATEACPFAGRLADPFTGAAYRYEAIDARSWRLCAAFETAPEDLEPWTSRLRDADGCTVHHLPPPVELRGPSAEAGRPPDDWQPARARANRAAQAKEPAR